MSTPATPTIEQTTDLEDWQAFRGLDRLADHWYWRPGWRPDRRYLTWYLLFDPDNYTDLGTLVADHQQHLRFTYLDLVPADGLHLTVQGLAFADDITPDETAQIGATARDRCADLGPFDLTIGPLAGYPGGVFLRAAPWDPVHQLRSRLRDAIGQTIGEDRVPDEPRRFKPHVTVGYCNDAAPAAELIARVHDLRRRPPLTITVHAAHLIELRREHHTYRWDVIESVHLHHGRSAPIQAHL
jgi:2'-5' RNA ligase